MSEPRSAWMGRRGQAVLLGSVGVLLVLAVLTVALVVRTSARGVVRTTAPSEPGITVAGSAMLGLDPQSPPWRAPSFSLTDQHGDPVTLADFRGKAVVLSFNDDRCEDLCSLLAEDVVAANHDLGTAASDVEFVSVNANPYFPDPGDVLAWTADHGLADAANWVFATGDPATLAHVASDYGVPIQREPADRSVVHGSELFFIDPSGKVAAMGQFGAESASTALFGHVMAQAAVNLLPGARSIDVAGPSPVAPSGIGAAVGSRAPSFTLPGVVNPSTSRGVGGGGARLTVLNFWSSTCVPCQQEMPAIEHVYQNLGHQVDVVGIDVADSRSAARALVRRSGVTYPLVADAQGTTAGAYRVTGLPFTVVIGTDGTVLIRRPGAITAEELEYTLETLAPA